MVAPSRSLPAGAWLLAAVAAAGASTTTTTTSTAAAAAAEHERFAAVETGAVLAPRLYRVGRASPLERREDGCRDGWHPCNDIGPPGENACCPNDQYCIVDPSDTTRAGCCSIGARCGGSPCDPTAYQCDKTTTITADGTADGTATTTTTVVPACCGRRCTAVSEFRCPASLGGGCCKFGSRCGADGRCVFTLTAPSSAATASPTPVDPALIPPPPGCETGQTSCPAELGGGCCPATQTCTLITGRAHCADSPPAPTGSDVTVIDTPGGGGGLSAGATAGVTVGVVVGAAVVLALAAWQWRRRVRQKEKGEGGGGSAHDGSSRPRDFTGWIFGGSGGARSARAGGMSDATSDAASGSGRYGFGGGGGVGEGGYFGLAPAVGPYSETNASAATVTTPGLDRGGVPVLPHGPGDIPIPVEIDSRVRGATAPGAHPPRESEGEEVREYYELYGSEVSQVSPTLPSPYGGTVPSPHDRPS
ncbi:hypothetical protein VTH06DRAFT_7032 [Thermothelomyces fergusii]